MSRRSALLSRKNAIWPLRLQRTTIPGPDQKNWDPDLIEVWRSREFLVQVFLEESGAQRMTVNRTGRSPSGRWSDGITWDELQRLKREIGRGECWAVEVYPADSDLVDVAAMRHLWILPERPEYAWRKRT